MVQTCIPSTNNRLPQADKPFQFANLNYTTFNYNVKHQCWQHSTLLRDFSEASCMISIKQLYIGPHSTMLKIYSSTNSSIWMKNVGNPLNASDDAMIERISFGDSQLIVILQQVFDNFSLDLHFLSLNVRDVTFILTAPKIESMYLFSCYFYQLVNHYLNHINWVMMLG
jgi:hypothetical protein